MSTQDQVIQRIRQLMYAIQKPTINSFGRFVGIDPSNLSKMMSGAQPISDKMLMRIADKCDVRFDWLAEGEEPMSEDKEEDLTLELTPSAFGSVTNVPIVHIDSVGGIHSDNDINSPEYIEGYIPIVGARKGDLAIYQSGDSMSPTIPSGAILQIREVVGWREYIGYGDVFVLLLDDERRITKAIYRYDEDPANYYLCVSYNSMVSDEPLPKSIIRRVWKVIRIFINKGW